MRFLILSLSCMLAISCNSNFMSKADFAAKCRTALIAKCPALFVTVLNKETLFIENSSKRDNVSLTAFYKEYTAAPGAVDSAVQHFINATGLVADKGAKIDLSKVFPVIKPTSCLSNGAKDQAFPLVNEPYNEQLIILYAENTKEGLSYITNTAFESLGISKDSLKALAIQNFSAAVLPKIKGKKSESGHAYLFTAESQYDAALILFPLVWVKEYVDVKGDIVMALPYPDMLYVAKSDDAEGIEWIKEEMQGVHMGGVQRISTDLFRWNGDRFIKYQ
ncbi:DUF1444 family protein [Chitinophaga sancti]|uniref:DUF1444 family protein n=1 Tax=Chitinophaga sancti TaxID=1004 RepID=A0A1K1SJV6_9BACT|nr:DUF1444 family protein [Chitinophaga sancti]WQD64478.1 DUF1444 family protein [Chitinophaga sancti]WQG89898.1 DUF1444 family protein [Chitinophaga sancti]SFW84436.1 Uncharacterized protein YtpQ, UPF0354 family [Chitinophaga sancti]